MNSRPQSVDPVASKVFARASAGHVALGGLERAQCRQPWWRWLHGLVSQVAGQYEEAQASLTEALTLAERTGYRYRQDRAHRGLATVRQSAGQLEEARQHWQHAWTSTPPSAP
jgi:tetratricopeptide (TPR) repeat protein